MCPRRWEFARLWAASTGLRSTGRAMRTLARPFRAALIAAAFVVFAPPSARAQDAPSEVLRGTVRNSEGAPFRNATVSVLPSTAAADARPFVARSDTAGHW